MVFLPIILAVLIAVGWTRDDYVEEEVKNIWIATDGDYHKDTNYADQYGKDNLGRTSFAAMAISRDGENLFTASRLEEIRARMESTEDTTVRLTVIDQRASLGYRSCEIALFKTDPPSTLRLFSNRLSTMV